jgi:hypothetical protein
VREKSWGGSRFVGETLADHMPVASQRSTSQVTRICLSRPQAESSDATPASLVFESGFIILPNDTFRALPSHMARGDIRRKRLNSNKSDNYVNGSKCLGY